MTTAGLFRRVIRIRAEDSPNVRLGLLQAAAGQTPTHAELVPGVVSYAEYLERRANWDAVRQCVGLDAWFYEGAEVLLYPPAWLNRAERLAGVLRDRGTVRRARAIGCDPAEGGDRSAWSVVDEHGLIRQLSIKTPDTTVVVARTLALMIEHNVPPHRVVFDRGGGGYQHACTLRDMGHRGVRSIGFGESLVADPKRGLKLIETRKEEREEHYAYVNRRAELYGTLRVLLDPAREREPSSLFPELSGFCLPAEYAELRRQLAPIPLLYDREGRMRMMPKTNPLDADDPRTLVKLIGHSPDEADSLVLAVHGMLHVARPNVAGAF